MKAKSKKSKKEVIRKNKGKNEQLKKNSSKGNKKKKNIGKKILLFFLSLCILGIIAMGVFFVYIVVSTAKFDPEALSSKDQTVVYDINGEVIATLGSEKRESIKYEDLPQVLVDALIATEDSRFFQHNGLDTARFIKASLGQLTGNSSAGGASTLTMQVVKNNLTSTERSIIRKFKDIYLSVFYLERKYTKEEILEFYLNDSLLGGSVYGVGQAAEYYFGKPVSDLNLAEASLIAGMFQSPNGYNPYYNPEAATERRKTVLKLMVRHGYITQEEADIANSISVESLLVGRGEETNYQGYIDTVVAEIEEKTDMNPYVVPMKVYTSMEKSIQDGINSVLSGETFTWENDKVQAGIAVVNVETGAVAAIGAGRNREGERTFNYATMAKRQPGSTAKPLFDYGPGFEYNNFSTYTLFNDEPWQYSDGKSINNWDGGYKGLVTLKSALSVSRNIPALKAFQQVSKKNINTFVTSIGIEPEYEDNVLHEAHAIGAFTGMTPLEMAGAYAAFASMGYYTEPYTVTKIILRENDEKIELEHKKEKVMSDSTAYLMNNALEYAVNYGFSGGAKVAGSHVAAKTGTSTYPEETLKKYGLPSWAVSDLWTAAYTSQYSIALWYGYDEISSEYYNTDGSPKGNAMAAVMRYIPKDMKGWTMPSSVVASQVEMGTWPAQLPSEYTPSDLILTEYFKKGTQPSEVSQRFNKLSNVSNVKSTVSNNSVTLSWKYTIPEVLTEKYLNEYFSQSVFGNSSSSFVNERLAYNNNVLGGIGFGIYLKDSDGLKNLGFTTNNSYTINTSKIYTKDATFVIKAEYKNFKSNASDGVEEKVTLNNTSSPSAEELEINIDNNSVVYNVKGYKEGEITVTYQGENVTNGANITYTIIDKNGSVLFSDSSSKDTFVSEMNKLERGEYRVKYTATYKGENVTKIKYVTLN